jgi:hypothetical protein
MDSNRFWRRFAVAMLVVGFSALTFSAASAQLAGGIKAGANFAKFAGDLEGIDDKDWRTAFIGGGSLTWVFGGKYAFQPELLFAQKGSKLQSTENGEILDAKARVDYVEVPVLFKVLMPFGGSGLAAPFLMAGPAFAYQTGCEVDLSADGIDQTLDCEDPDLEAKIHNTDWSAVLGAGFGIPVGSGALVLDGRYQFGLRNINAASDPDDFKNRSFALMVGLSFPFGGPIVTALAR